MEHVNWQRHLSVKIKIINSDKHQSLYVFPCFLTSIFTFFLFVMWQKILHQLVVMMTHTRKNVVAPKKKQRKRKILIRETVISCTCLNVWITISTKSIFNLSCVVHLCNIFFFFLIVDASIAQMKCKKKNLRKLLCSFEFFYKIFRYDIFVQNYTRIPFNAYSITSVPHTNHTFSYTHLKKNDVINVFKMFHRFTRHNTHTQTFNYKILDIEQNCIKSHTQLFYLFIFSCCYYPCYWITIWLVTAICIFYVFHKFLIFFLNLRPSWWLIPQKKNHLLSSHTSKFHTIF